MIFTVDNKLKKIIATLQDGDKIEKYECVLTACENPVCTCGIVYLILNPIQCGDKNEKLPPMRKVEIDIIEKSLGYRDKESIPKQDIEFAIHLLSKLDDGDFQILYERHFAYKNKISEKAEPDSIKAHFEYDEVEYDGLMYAYCDILPYGNQFYVTIKDKEYTIIDQYCLLPKCSCSDVYLDIDYINKNQKIGDTVYTLSLNYIKKKWRIIEGDPYNVSVNTIISAIENQIPNFYKQILDRHKKVKTIYAHCKKRHSPEKEFQVPTIGRNDPCPCGSGKKYKKCCLLK